MGIDNGKYVYEGTLSGFRDIDELLVREDKVSWFGRDKADKIHQLREIKRRVGPLKRTHSGQWKALKFIEILANRIDEGIDFYEHYYVGD